MKNSIEVRFKRGQMIKVILFYLSTFAAIFFWSWIVLEEFGYTTQNVIVVAVMLLPLAAFFGYLLSRLALEPLFATNDLLDRLLKETLHELNIPLATILANVTMLKRKAKAPTDRRRLERIEQAARDLGHLYEDLDYYIKKEIGGVEKEPCDLQEIVVASVQKMAEIKGDITIQQTVGPTLIYADRRGCQKAIDNLIANAIKYNRPGGWVKVVLDHGILTIQDSGIGMDEATLFSIFDRYFQSDRGASGYGIGLHIVKTFCDEHGVRITINSKVGQGTLFRLYFQPLVCSPQGVPFAKKSLSRGS